MTTAEGVASFSRGGGMTRDERFVIVASSTGTVLGWYDFYLYATLAPFFAALFFPPGNDTAALSAFATYAAGFLSARSAPLSMDGDLVGRKYTRWWRPPWRRQQATSTSACGSRSSSRC